MVATWPTVAKKPDAASIDTRPIGDGSMPAELRQDDTMGRHLIQQCRETTFAESGKTVVSEASWHLMCNRNDGGTGQWYPMHASPLHRGRVLRERRVEGTKHGNGSLLRQVS